MSDHDQRFKSLMREFIAEFFQFFYPHWADRFDFSQIEWLDKEIFTDPPDGPRRILDLVAKLQWQEFEKLLATNKRYEGAQRICGFAFCSMVASLRPGPATAASTTRQLTDRRSTPAPTSCSTSASA